MELEFVVRIPQWKAYLYTLIERIKLYKWLNSNWIKFNFSKDEFILLHRMFKKYITKGVMQKPRVYRYEELIKSVLVENLGIADKEEIELAMRLSWINYIKTEDLIMELKQLKEFGKEVGIKPLAMGKMNEEALILEILKSVDPKAEYSQEFIAWYENDVPDKYFDAAETKDPDAPDTPASAGDDSGSDDFSELIEAINEITKVGELKEICDDKDFKHLFESIDTSKFKTAKPLKEAMLACLVPKEESSNTEGLEVDEDTKNELIGIIHAISNEDELIEFVSDETVESIFGDKLTIGDEIDVEGLKAQMLNLLGYEEPKEETKPMTLKEKMAAKKAADLAAKSATVSSDMVIPFDPNSFDPDEVYTSAEGLNIPQLRKFAKQLEITAPAGSKKDDILEMIATKLTEMAEGGAAVADSTCVAETAVTKATVNAAIAAGDTESLIAMCDQFKIKLNALQKKSAKIMGTKLLEIVPDDEPVKRDIPKTKLSLSDKLKAKDKSAPTTETKSIYQMIEEMVLEGKDESEITAAVKPLYTEKGKTILYIKKRVKQMIEIVKLDNE